MNTFAPRTGERERRRIDLAGIGFVDIMALICVIIVGTRFEFPGMAQGAGLALAIRLAAALLVLGIYVARGSTLPTSQNAIFIFLVCYYFTAINVHEYSYFTFMGTAAMAWGLSVAPIAIAARSTLTDFLLSGYLVFHVVGIAIALAWRVFFGEFIDLHNMLFPFSISRGGEVMGVSRLAGFHVEPGTYSNYVYLFVLLRALLFYRIVSGINTIAMASLSLTASAWAIIAMACYFAAGLTEMMRCTPTRHRATRIVLMCAASVVFVIAITLLSQYLIELDYVKYIIERYFGEGVDVSRDDKIAALGQWWQRIGDCFLIGCPLSETFCPTCRSPQDVGLALNFAFNFGILPSVLLWVTVFVGLLRKWGLRFLVSCAPLLVNKAFFYDPLIWFVIGVILLSPMRRLYARELATVENRGEA